MSNKNNKHNSNIFEIPLAEARELTQAWAAQNHFIKGYLTDAQELKDITCSPKPSLVSP